MKNTALIFHDVFGITLIKCVQIVRYVWAFKNAGFSEPKWYAWLVLYVQGIVWYFSVSMRLLLKYPNKLCML